MAASRWGWTLLGTAAIVLGAAGAARAVVLDVMAAGATGPVTLEVRIDREVSTLEAPTVPPLVVTTGSDGRAEVVLPDHLIGRQIFIKPVSEPGQTVRLTVPATRQAVTVPLAVPWMVQNPGFFGGFGVAAGFAAQFLDDPKITKDQSVGTARFPDGSVQTATTGDAAAADRRNDISLDLIGGFIDFPIGLPSFPAGPVRLFIAPTVSLGFFDVNFESRNRETGATTKFDGDTIILEGGVELLAQFTGTPWFAFVSASGGGDVAGGDLDRQNAAPVPGGQRTQDRAEFDYTHYVVKLGGGHVFRTGLPFLQSFAAAGGIAYENTQTTISGLVEATFDNGVITQNLFTNEFEAEGVKGLVRLDAHFAGPVFGRVEVLFDDRDVSVLAKGVWRFDVLP
jgi:hypothetical protein